MNHLYQEILTRHVKPNVDGTGGRTFDVEDFFNDWFYKHGRPYSIFFKQNLEITNLQYAELCPLVRQYTHIRDPLTNNETPAPGVMFHSSEDFKNTSKNIVLAFINGFDNSAEIKWDIFFAAYGSILMHGVILDARFGSCSLLLPPCLSVTLSQVCAQSGYIDSCGPQIYLSQFDRGTFPALIDHIKSYIELRTKKSVEKHRNEKINLAIWSHEDSSKTNVDNLKGSGLNSFKIYRDKVRLGNIKLGDIFKIIFVIAPHLKNYINVIDNSNNDRQPEKCDGTIWILQDRDIQNSSYGNFPGKKRYVICYHQIFKSCNPLHFFDENKPAWIAPITMPHSMLGAMINITRPWGESTIKIHDPFCGTGSLVVECLKDAKIFASGSDLSDFTQLLLKDNLAYFAASSDDLHLLCTHAKNLCSIDFEISSLTDADIQRTEQFFLNNSKVSISKSARNDFIQALRLALEYKTLSDFVDQEKKFKTTAFVKSIDLQALIVKFFFYIALRAEARATEVSDPKITWIGIFREKAGELVRHISDLAKWKDRENSKERKFPRLPAELRGCRHTDFGFFELGISPEIFERASSQDKFKAVSIASATSEESFADGLYDVVVTDPPYGFNTTEVEHQLANLYADFIKVWVRKLKPKGHFVICLPQETYNGQILPYCTKPQLIVSQVMAAVADIGLQVIVPAKTQASHVPGAYPPYYWESSKVLRRVVLHFQIDSK